MRIPPACHLSITCLTQGLFNLPGFSHQVREGVVSRRVPPRTGHHIGVAVTIHVNRQIAQVFQVTA